MKKALAIVLVVVLALSLVACATSTTSSSSSPAASAAKPSASAPASAAASAPAASASASAAPGSAAPKTGGVLKIVNSAEGSAPIGIPWAQATLEQLLLAPFFEELIKIKTNGDIIPCLAESWKIDDKAKELVMNIRPNVTFTDGSKLTADVAGWNIMQQVKAKVVTNITGYETRGDMVLVLKFDTWTNTILGKLGAVGLCSKESFEKKGEAWAKENPVGTGPFMLKEYVHGSKLTAVKNPNYWQKGKPYLDGIEFNIIRDSMAQNMAIQATGKDAIDVLNINSAEQVSMLKAANLFNVTILGTGPVSITPNTIDEKTPLAKLEVRQAISYAIDRASIVAARGFGICTPGVQNLDVTSPAHLPDSYNLSYDVAKAKDLLTKAGYPNGFKMTLYMQPGVADKEVAVAVQKMLAAVNITADLQFPDAGGYSKLRSTGWDGVLLHGMRQMSNPFSTFFLYFDKAQTFMVSAKRPAGWAEAMDKAEQAPAPDKALLQEVHKLMLTNLVSIPVYNMTDNWVMKKNVHDTHYGDIEHCNLADAWIG